MKKIIGRITGIIIFIMVTLASFFGISVLFRPVTNSRMNICGYYAEEKNTIDMVYIGGSAAYVYYEPLEAFQEFGFTSYNFASDSMTPQVIKYCIIEARKTQTPEVFVVDLRPFQYGDHISEETGVMDMDDEVALRNTIDQFAYSKNRFDMVEASVRNKQDRIYYHLDISKYHSRIYSLLDKKAWKFLDNKEEHPYKGFAFIEKKEPINFVDQSAVETVTPLTEDLDGVFRDLLQYCKDENLNVLFVVHPYMILTDHQEKYNYMEQVIAEYGLAYLNANDYDKEIGLDYANDFFNLNHVNVYGADKYTHFLGQYLMDHYDLRDKREEAQYQSWKDLIPDFEKEKEKTKEVINQL